MSTAKIVCEQAIFTSARSPTGEGYRIVAASKGLRPEEKQKITRFSPSHESLCVPEVADAQPLASGRVGDTRQFTSSTVAVASLPRATKSEGAGADESIIGAAFYPLPGGRLCIAASRHAGAEHTGRGGQRVYTHNFVVSGADFEAIGFNPFNLLRAIPPMTTEMFNTPGGAIPALELTVNAASASRMTSQCSVLLPVGVRLAAVQQLLEGKPTVLNLPCDWQAWAEALLLSIPAPLRTKVSFAAGLRFSAARPHTLSILRDEKNTVKGRVAPQGICFLGARSTPPAVMSHWLDFIDRHWVAGDLPGLARRTSRKFEDCTQSARERIGELFNIMDALPQTENLTVLNLVFRSFNALQPGVEADLRREFRDAAQRQLRDRLGSATWIQIKPIWSQLVEFWRNGSEAALFAQPLLHVALGAALRSDPLTAAELALTVSQVPNGADRDAHESMMSQVANRLKSFHPHGSDELGKLAKLATRWLAIRPECPLMAQTRDRLNATHSVN
jgi:hypothetical protein